ncbi:MAG: hypothetical protein COT73_02765 [Bdellovibrio sp. CG10_big_fil_rev_8_21_14_0_10_47_8]|nr:MAG: hypothetical protein COT73_02765 [Bdellovibrio sp. CG10_big_fil_rev_8_21_14_0_10_47_8]
MAGPKKRQSILLVDDEKDLLNLYKMNLKSVDADVQAFTDPLEALRFIKENPSFDPDVLISDFMMPKMKGIELIQEVVKLRPDVTTILLSAYLDKEKAINAANSGVFYILEKPVVKEAFVSITRSYLQQSLTSKLHKEMETVMVQMKELFSVFRILCLDEMDLQTIRRPSVQSDPNSVTEKAISIEQAMTQLDEKLKSLSQEEQEIKKAA